MASIFELAGGQDASKVNIDRDTGFATLKATITELAGQNISFDVRETDTTTGASAVTTYTQVVAPAALALVPATITLNENPIPGLDIGQITATGGTGGYTFAENGGNNEIEVSPDGLVSPKASLGGLANPSAWSYATNTSFTFPIIVTDGASNTATGNLTIVLQQVATAPTVTNASITVPEATTVGTQIAAPADFGTSAASFDEVIFVSGNDAGKFAVNPTTGAVTLAGAVDALVTSGYAPTLRFSKNVNGAALSSFATMVTTIALSNRAPALAIANATTSLPEATSTASAVAVGTVTLTEIDGGLGTNVLAISGADEASFELGTPTTAGAVTSYPLRLKAGTSLDFTVKTTYTITITSSDAALPGQDQAINYTLTITDSNTPPVAPATIGFAVLDNAAVDSVVGTITVTDAQSTVTASITVDDPTSPGRFAVANNGQITIAQALPLASAQATHQQTIRWTDDRGAFTETVVTYTVTAGARINNATYSVDEDVAIGFTIATLPVTFNGNTLTYAITAGDPNDQFTFVGNALQTAAALDFEMDEAHTLTVSATETGGSDSATITIEVNNIAEPIVAPSISGGPLNVDENQPIGTVVGNLTVNAGNDPGATITLVKNVAGNPPADFVCDLAGQVTTTKIFNFEQESSQSVIATITNSDSSDSASFTIFINNRTDEFVFTNPSVFIIPSSSLEVSGGTIIGTPKVVTTSLLNATATGPSNAEVLFTIDSATDCKFRVNGVDATSFTRQQLGSGLVTFVAISSGTTGNYFTSLDQIDPEFTVTVSDTGATGIPSQTVTVSPTFTAEFVASNILDAGIVPNTELRAISIRDTAAQTQIVRGSMSGGQFERTTAPGTSIFTWFQSEIDAGQITVIQTGPTTISLQPRGSNNLLGAAISDTIPVEILVAQDFKVPSDYIQVAGTSNRSPAYTVTPAMLEATLLGTTAANLNYTVNSATNAQFRLNGTVATAFSQANINAGNVTFEYVTANGWAAFYGNQSSLSPAATLTVAAPGNSETFALVIVPQPAVTVFDIITPAPAAITTSELNAIGIGSTNAQLVYTASTSANFRLSGTLTNTFTNQDIIDGLVTFEGSGSIDVFVTGNNGEISETYTFDSVGTITNATYTASSAFSGTPTISNAIMTDSVFGGSSFVGTNTGAGQFVRAAFAATTIVGVRVAGGNGTNWGGIATYLNNRSVQTTNDGTTWTTRATVTGVTDSNGNVDIIFAAPVVAATGVQLIAPGSSGLSSIVSTSELVPLTL